MTKTEQFRKQLARVFDNDLRTKQWENIPDYIIIGLIVLSTLSVFISTFDVSPACQQILHIIDLATVAIFMVEVSLRIWVADELDPKYKGFLGRVRYCLSFYGLIDILSTYSFYVAFLFHCHTLCSKCCEWLVCCESSAICAHSACCRVRLVPSQRRCLSRCNFL